MISLKELLTESKSFKPEKRRALKPGEIEIMKGREDRQTWFYTNNEDDAKQLVRMGRNSAFPTGITKNKSKVKFDKGWMIEETLKEAKSDYEVYHKSYTSAINAAKEYAEKKGYEINDDDSFRQIGMGPRKPSEGKTNKFSIELSKDGKVQRKKLQIQVYGMRNSYELNVYIQ